MHFDLNGHGSGSIPDQTVAKGGTVLKPSPDPTETGCDFDGWYREAACATAWDFSADVMSRDTTLYAKWTAKALPPSGAYTISFHANGGSVSPESMVTGTDGKLRGKLPVPARSSYLFEGWFTTQAGGTEIKADTIFVSNKTVYAHWRRVSGDGTGGSGSSGGSGGSGGGASRRSANTAAGAGGQGLSGNSGSWKQDAKGWWYRYNGGSYPKSEWKLLPCGSGTAWYAFDEEGYMRTGWFQSGAHWYYLSEANDAALGKMITGWAKIGGKWYYLEPVGNAVHPLGAMYADEKTPDGYSVDAGGVWME